MKYLNIIQVLAKIAHILSKIIFVFCIVGFCLSIVGIISLGFDLPALKIGGVTIEGFLKNELNISKETMLVYLIESLIVSLCTAILSKLAARYFGHELADGTPFTRDSAKEMLRLGIVSFCVPIAAQIVFHIVLSVLASRMPGVAETEMDYYTSTGFGLMLIVMSLLCGYGAEVREVPAAEVIEDNSAES